jgi:uncharacterized protein YggE
MLNIYTNSRHFATAFQGGKMKKWLLVCVLSGLGSTAAVSAADSREPRHITVQGHGKFTATPDQAKMRIQVVQEGSRVDTVTQDVRRKMEAVLKVIRSQGVGDKDIQTLQYRVSPKMEWRGNRSSMNGFTASNQVEVTVRDLKKVGAVLGAVLDAGANDVNGPDFGFDNPQALEQKALGLAVQDARAKAGLLARSADATLGDVISIEEGASFRPGPRPVMAMARAVGAPEVGEEPIAPGQETVESSVTVVFGLK